MGWWQLTSAQAPRKMAERILSKEGIFQWYSAKLICVKEQNMGEEPVAGRVGWARGLAVILFQL
jgi:hypothetical protein